MGRSESLRGWRHRKIGFSMDPGLKVLARLPLVAAARPREEISKKLPKLRDDLSSYRKTTLHYARVFLHHLEISTIQWKTFSHCCCTVPSIPHSCARKRCRWRPRIISGQLRDFPVHGLNKYTHRAALSSCSINLNRRMHEMNLTFSMISITKRYDVSN